MQCDNEVNGQPCDNISRKNDVYCELTIIYWAWKNLRKLYPDVKYVGLFHYRRFFAFRNIQFAVDITKDEKDIESYRINSQEVIRILESGKIILPRKFIFPYSVMADYCVGHVSDDYRSTKEVIRTKFPDYYDDFITVMEQNNKLSSCNMFVMKYEDFTKYCEWLFAVLAEVEPLVPYQYYNSYQKRALAMMAERLLNVYVRKNKLRASYSSVYYYGESKKRKGFLWSFYYAAKNIAYALRRNLSLKNLSFVICTDSLVLIKKRIKKLFLL